MRKKPATLALLLSVTLCGCSVNGKGIEITGTAAQICETWKPVFPSKEDRFTADTAIMIAGNNEANRKWCGTGPPPKPVAKKDAKTS